MSNPFEQKVSNNFSTVISLISFIVFLPILILGAINLGQILVRATGTPAKIIVDVKSPLETIHMDFTHAYAQGGEEMEDMIKPVLDDVKALHPKLIRIDHIYDHYDVVGKNGNELTYNFTKLDQAIDTILATGAKPVLALSYMPKVIAKNGVIINPPNNWDEWSAVVQRTVEHYSGRNEKNISGIYYEVWNEPDLEIFGKWGLTGDKNYVTLYRFSAAGANRAQNTNQFSLGGPTTTGLYKSWILALVTSGLRVDFISWHSYLADPKQFNVDQRNIISWLLSYPRYTLLPKLITEFGFDGAKNAGYNSMYAAAHTAAVIRQIVSGNPTYAFSFELKDGQGQENGMGWGMITHEKDGKRKKPRYYVYNFLDVMDGTRLAVTGEGTWVTGFASTKDDTFRLMLVNFDQNDSHSEHVPVSFQNLEPGTYSYRERFLLGRDVTFTETITPFTNSLNRDVYMSPSSVAVLEVKKLK